MGEGDEQTHTKNPPKHRKLKQEEHERQNLTRTHLEINLSNMSQINRIMREHKFPLTDNLPNCTDRQMVPVVRRFNLPI